MKTMLRSFFAALSLLFVCSSGLLAQTNVTWIGAVDNTWENAGNWTLSTVPNATDAIATFGGAGPTSLSLSTTIDLDQLNYQSGAQAYTIGIAAAGRLNLNGAGSVNASTSPQTITVGGSDLNGYAGWLSFQNSASAGTGTYVGYGSTQSYGAAPTAGGGGQISFNSTSTAGTATFTVNGASVASSDGSQLMFHGSSTAANATFTTTGSGGFSGGQLYFWDTATAASSTITNEKGGQTYFFGNSTAGTATITASGGTADYHNPGQVYFFGGTGDNAIITANGGADGGYGGSIYFYGGTAGNATVNANGGTNGGYGSTVSFNGSALGGTATFKINTGATMDISGHESTSALTIGSLEGSGNLSLGARSLIVGSNNTSTTFSGVISDNGGGALGKTGTGTFRLTGANTYSGGTTIDSGTLVASGGYSTTSSLGTGGVTVNSGGTLAGNDFIVGAATINSGGHLSPGDPGAGGTGVLRFDGGLTLMGGSQVDFRLNDAAPTFLVVNGGAFNATDGSVTLNFIGSTGFASSTLYTLVDFTNASSHDFTDLTHFLVGSVGVGTAADYTLELNGSLLQVMTSSAIPEPSTYAVLAGLGALGLVGWKRRKMA